MFFRYVFIYDFCPAAEKRNTYQSTSIRKRILCITGSSYDQNTRIRNPDMYCLQKGLFVGAAYIITRADGRREGGSKVATGQGWCCC